jgi:hypothetical protein
MVAAANNKDAIVWRYDLAQFSSLQLEETTSKLSWTNGVPPANATRIPPSETMSLDQASKPRACPRPIRSRRAWGRGTRSAQHTVILPAMHIFGEKLANLQV